LTFIIFCNIFNVITVLTTISPEPDLKTLYFSSSNSNQQISITYRLFTS